MNVLSRKIEIPLLLGPVALLLLSLLYSLLEVQVSTDTYIGLAGGRAILEATDGFPYQETFSYAVDDDRVWFNQNWLTHAWQYWLYDAFGPNAVIYGTWALKVSLFLMLLLAVWFRCGDVLAAMLAVAVAAVGSHNYLEPRPATTGYFMVAAFWTALCALEGQGLARSAPSLGGPESLGSSPARRLPKGNGSRRRWWPIALMLPLLVLWGCAHGSFLFGYVMLLLYVAYWLLRWAWNGLVVPRGRPVRLFVDVVLALLTAAACGLVFWTMLGPDAAEQWTAEHVRQAVLVLAGALVAAGLLYAAFVQDRSRPPAISMGQMNALAAVLVLAFVITAIFGPFHLANFFHVREVVQSDVWRRVSEWIPPYQSGQFPPVGLFWWILVVASLAALLAGVAAAVLRVARRDEAPVRSYPVTAFDVLIVVVGLLLALFARRFVPMFLILAAPVAAVWFMHALRRLPAQQIRVGRISVIAAAWLAALNLGVHTWDTVQRTLIKPFADRPDLDLLGRMTRADATPQDALRYLRENDLSANVLTEWSLAGPLMFYAPDCRVFVDGRAQQVYDEKHYFAYQWLVTIESTPAKAIDQLLDATGTQVVLLRYRPETRNLRNVLQTDLAGKWTIALAGRFWTLYARIDGAPFQTICRRVRDGSEWRPDTPGALGARGFVWRHCSPPDLERALTDWRDAVQQRIQVGALVWPPMTEILLQEGQSDLAMRYLAQQAARLRPIIGELSETDRLELRGALQRCNEMLQAAGAAESPGG